MEFIYHNVAISQVDAVIALVDWLGNLLFPAGFLVIFTWLGLHLIECHREPQTQLNTVEPELSAPALREAFAVEPEPEVELTGQSTPLTCSIDDAPRKGQACPLASPLACAVERVQKHQAVDYRQLTIRQLKKAASAWNQANPQQKIRSFGKLTKTQLIEQLIALAA